MKKHLIAAAVAAAVAMPAAAQVTVSGVIDTAIGSVNNGATSFTGSTNNILGTSNIRFSGTEDLGGGLKATFTLMQEFTASEGLYGDRTMLDGHDGVLTSSSTTSPAQQDRMTNLNVALSGGFGTVTLGKHGALARNAGGAGSFIGNVGLSGAYGSTSSRILGDKVNDAFSYTTPTFSGVTAQIFRGSRQGNVFTAAEAATTALAAKAIKQQTSALGATYGNGPLMLGAGLLKRENSTTSDSVTQVIGGSYDLKVAKIGFVRSEHEKDDKTMAADNKLKTTVLQFSAPISGAVTLIGAYHDAEAESGADNSATGIVLGATYALSKRTTGYFVYSKVDNDTNSDYTLTGMTALTSTTTGNDPKTVSIGLRHSF